VPKPPRLALRGGCSFEDAGVQVHLGADPDFRPAHKAHLALVVDDLLALVARLEAAGHPVRLDEAHGGFARAHVDDPFGNRIEAMGPDRDS